MSESLAIHHEREAHPDTSLPDTHQDTFSKTFLGFWIYLMTDCILFSTLFIAYAVLSTNHYGGPGPKELFHLSDAFMETLFLLLSSFTCGLAMMAMVKDKRNQTLLWFGATFILGALFLYSEVSGFSHHIANGDSWTRSGFLSAYFGLVGTHGLHITVGLSWLTVLAFQLLYYGINADTFRRSFLFSLFWHFLDLVWIFVFTLVYLIGVI